MSLQAGDRVQLTGEHNLAMVGLFWPSSTGRVTRVFRSGPNVLLNGDECATAWDWEDLIPAPTPDPAVNRRLAAYYAGERVCP